MRIQTLNCKMYLFTLLTASVISLTSCSIWMPQEPLPQDKLMMSKELTVDLFAARGFLGGSSYERYYLENKTLWRECGRVREVDDDEKAVAEAKSNPDDVFAAHPNLKPKEKTAIPIPADQLLEMKRKFFELTVAFKSAKNRRPEPGSPLKMIGPGIFDITYTFNGEKRTFSTSVDNISTTPSELDARLNEAFALIRSVGEPPCGNATFFGIGLLK